MAVDILRRASPLCLMLFLMIQCDCKVIAETLATSNAKGLRRKQYTVAVVEFMQETNSFSPVLTTRKEFEGSLLLYNSSEILEHCETKETHGHVGGFLQAVQEHGHNQVKVVPILQARSVSGGPLERQLYDHFHDTILSGIRKLYHNKEQPLDGIYLSLHGAMGVQGMLDPEGHLLQAIRNVVGNALPIGVSHDLHANLTQKRMSLMTFLIGYRTNPHRDFQSVGHAAGKILVQTIQGRIKPTMAYKKMRLLKGGGLTIDFLYPMRQVFNWMYYQEKADSRILWLSTFMVHIWLDDPELGWTTVAVTDDHMELAKDKAEELAHQNWQVRNEPHPTGISPQEAISMVEDEYWFRRYFGTVVLCDVSDAVGAGAPGESTWILRALLDHDRDQHSKLGQGYTPLTSYVTLRDAAVVNHVLQSEFKVGETLTLTVGGKLDLRTNKPVSFTG